MPRGGARPGAGRKSKPGPRPKLPATLPEGRIPTEPTAETKRAVGVLVDLVPPEQLAEINARLKGSPLEVVNALAEMPLPPNLTPDQERWERRFRLECHKIAMPYTHPRLVAVAHELAPPASARVGYHEKVVTEGEQSNELEIARRIAFALAEGAAKAKAA